MAFVGRYVGRYGVSWVVWCELVRLDGLDERSMRYGLTQGGDEHRIRERDSVLNAIVLTELFNLLLLPCRMNNEVNLPVI